MLACLRYEVEKHFYLHLVMSLSVESSDKKVPITMQIVCACACVRYTLLDKTILD